MNFISKKGIQPIAILVFLTILASFFSDFLGTIFLLLTLFSLYVFRDVPKYIYENKESILSPVDGEIIAIDKINDKVKIYCRVSLFDDHTLRAPFTGDVKVQKFHKGLHLNPNSLKAKSLNEQIVYRFYSEDNKISIKLKLLSGFFNIAMEKIEDKCISQGDKLSFFVDGIAIITLKNNSNLLVNLGDKLSSGQSILYKK